MGCPGATGTELVITEPVPAVTLLVVQTTGGARLGVVNR